MNQRKKVVIIGGVAGGASTAARLRRLDEGAEILMVERGPYISFANCGLPYHISGKIEDREELILFTSEEFSERFNVRVLTRTEAMSIDSANREIELKDLATGRVFRESYDHLVLSPGAEPVRPPIPGVDLPGVLTLRNVPDLDRIMEYIRTQGVRSAVVVGGGFIGVETAENLIERGIETSLIERGPHVMGLLDSEIAAFLQTEMRSHGARLFTGVNLTAIREDGRRLVLTLEGRPDLTTDLVILAIGVKPETRLAASAGIKLGPQGGIAVDDRMRTSNPAIFAVGDAVEVRDRVTGAIGRVPLAGPANRQGRVVADVISGRDTRYRGTLGTSIVKVFGLAAASTGLSEKAAQRNNIPYEKAVIHSKSHAGYYPGAEQLMLKILFHPGDGGLLGAQVVGRESVDKRIDVLATALAAGWTVYDLEDLDLAYAPPFSSAKDPVNHVGTVAAGILRGDHPAISLDQLPRAKEEGAFLLDVRSAEEFARGSIPGAQNIPVDQLRSNLARIPKDRKIVTYCEIGVRGYLAVRQLMQNNFDAANLLGGYRLWNVIRNNTNL